MKSYKIGDEYVTTFEKQTSFPAINIGHLAVKEGMQSRKVGRTVLDFVIHTFAKYDTSGCQFITVDSLNNPRTNKFYSVYGFINQTNSDSLSPTRRMYIPIQIYKDDEDEGIVD